MYGVSPEYENAIYGNTRIIRGKAVLNGIELEDDGAIQTISITRPAIGEALMGSALSAKITLTALDPSGQLANIKDGAELSVFLGVENESTGAVEWLPFQTVTCDSVEYDPDSKTCTVSGFDNMALLESKTFKDVKITYPSTLRQIAEKVASVQGLSVSSQPFFMEDLVYTQSSSPNLGGEETLREVMAWIAEAALSNAIIGRDGKIHFISMIPGSSVSTIDAKDYFTFEPASVFGPINTLVLGRLPQEDNIFREDSSAVAQHGSKELRINDNPFLDLRRESVIDQYFAKVNGLQVIPYTLDWRGNPAIDPGDTIQAVDSKDKPVTVLFGNSEIEFDGGLRFETALEIKSLTETDKSKATSVKETVRKTQLEVDKANQTITALVEKTEGYDTQFSEIRQDLDSITSTVSSEIGNLQEQIDGQIQTWFDDDVPTSANAPAKDWTTTAEKNNHLGDLFYIVNNSTAGGRAYRWALVGSVYQWVLIEDEDVAKALADAAKAQDTADGKRRVFVSQPVPPYDVGDLWTQGPNGGIYRCKVARQSGNYAASDWELASDYTNDEALEDFVDNTYTPTIEGMKQETSEIKQTMDSISLTVSSIEIGGTNILRDSNAPTLDASSTGERRRFQSAITENESVVASWIEIPDAPEGIRYGAQINVVTSQTLGNQGLCFYTSTGVPLINGEKYTISCYARNTEGVSRARMAIWNHHVSPLTDLSQTWERLVYTFTFNDSISTVEPFALFQVDTSTVGITQMCGFKIERGGYATDWYPAPEDVPTFDNISESVNETVQQVYEDMYSNIDIESDKILLEVSEKTYTKDDTNKLINGLSSEITQTKNSFNIQFTNLGKSVDKNEDDLNAYKNLVETYIRFSSSGIELGKNNSPFSAVLGTDRLAFLQDGEEIAYLSNNKLYITNAEVLDRFTVGNPSSGYFDWVPRDNGNLGMKWRKS